MTTTPTTEPDRSRLAGEAKKSRKVRFTGLQWDGITAFANKAGVPVAEYLRRIVDIHLNQESTEDRTAKRLRNLERRMSDVEESLNKLNKPNSMKLSTITHPKDCKCVECLH